MIVTTAVRTRAILDLFADQDLEADACLPLERLRDYWKRIGLRHDDMVEGLRDLVFRNFVIVEYEAEQFQLRLTADGVDHCRRRAQDRAQIDSILGRARARARQAAGAAEHPGGRRYVDRSSARRQMPEA